MNMTNHMGRLTKPIELKQTQAGKSVATFFLAVKRPFTKDTTDFFKFIAWGKQAEVIAKYVNKGDQVVISGYLQNNEWTDKSGNSQISTEIVVEDFYLCGSKTTVQATNTSNPINYVPDEYFAPPKGDFEAMDESNEDVPFN